METIFSSTNNPDSYNPDLQAPSDSQNPKSLPNMSSTDEDDTQKTLPLKPQNPETPDSSIDNTQEEKTQEDNGEEIEGEGEEEEGECGFCLFMKGGGCKESFVAWENCVEEAEKNKEDVVDKCFEITSTLRKCMEAHADYYEPILRAEKAAQDEAVKELEKEKADEKVQSNEKASEKVESNENAAGN
ncbi:hypothetical protein ACOSQ2_018299 [Xanthoceras sorbifolium]